MNELYIAGVFVSSLYGVVTLRDMNRTYGLDMLDNFDCAQVAFVSVASWAGFLGTLLFRLTAKYGLWGARDD